MLNTLHTRKLIIPFVLIFIFILFQMSWTGDDAFITMRTVDNFVHGYGLRWNLDERVQVFTHPLWMFLLIAVYSLVRDPYLTLIGLSITVSTITFFLFLTLVPRTNISLIFAGMILLFSKAFIDYSTSGLENPATHLLLLGFCIVVLSSAHPMGEKRIFVLSLLAGLLMLNRMDAILFVLPILAFVLWQNRSRRTLALFIAGMSPYLIWEAFSIIYYGFPFPNAYYAKLNSGVPASALMSRGLLYFLNSLSLNPITLVIIFTALGLTFAGKEAPDRWLALGVCLYLGYIVYIGGDFMSGRFFTAPLIVSTILLIRRVEKSTTLAKWAWVTLVFALGWLLAPVKSYDNPITTFDSTTGISDEMFWYHPYTNLLFLSRETSMADHSWERKGKTLRENGTRVSVEGGVGILGFFAGPKVHIIDYLALADPFLARLPIANLQDWRIGHYGRALPEGYRESLESGENRIQDPALAEYYRQLRLITSGPIWSAERWRAIWMMNTGRYNDLLAEYWQ